MKNEKNILVINDPASNWGSMESAPGQDSIVFTFANSQQAIEILHAQKAQIVAIVFNIEENAADAYAFLEQLQYSRIPILVTAVERAVELKVFSLAAADFVLKPYPMEVMHYRLAHLVQLNEKTTLTRSQDYLTGLYNKDAFYQKVQAELLDEETQFDILSIDIERFKLINDTYGVSVGDDLLRYLAENMKSYFKQEGGFCARMSGDQFVAFCPRRELYVDKILKRAKKDLRAYPLDMNLTIKFGIYQIDDRSIPIAAMCDRAILAARNIKGKYGEHYAFYDDSIRKRLLLEQMIVDTMKDALEQEQFHVYMQPKYDLITGAIVGAESLVRWFHPERGLLSPDTFIPLFERNGFITELDCYVWDKTCAFLAERIGKNRKCVPISVNVSRIDVYNSNLPQLLLSLVQKYNLNPQYLHLEITETAYMENQDQLILVINRLKELGFMIEMDDFGTGYSSLSMLSELPIDILKLDMSLIQRETEPNHNILSFIISLAKWMNLLVVAEGVETREQVNLLRNMDCDYVQGYYYARPLPSDDFAILLANAEISPMPQGMEEKTKTDGLVFRQSKGDLTILIIDDSGANRSALTEIFSDLYTVVEADNATVAYQYIKGHFDEIAVILLDLIMPGMDGFQLMEKLYAHELYCKIPIIITAQAEKMSEARALSLGAADFIAKPYHKELAIHRVRNVIAGEKLQLLTQEEELLHRMRQMEKAAKSDALTGLCNRNEMERRMREYFVDEPDAKMAFVLLDVDNCKPLNTQLGHIKGDTVIRTIAERLRTMFSVEDTICRIGDDEFAVFSKEFVDHTPQRLSELLAHLKFVIDGIEVTVSIGVAIAPKDGKAFQTLYENADIALLTAKRLGKSQYCVFTPEMKQCSRVFFGTDRVSDQREDPAFLCHAWT